MSDLNAAPEPQKPSKTKGQGAKPSPLQGADRYQIFEQAALERLRSGSDQTKPTDFLPLPVRLAAITAMAITGLGLLWSVFARVPVQVSGVAAIVPEGAVNSVQAKVDGILQYQVSGAGPDRLNSLYRLRNQDLSSFWDAVVVKSRPTLDIQQLVKLVNEAQLPARGQALLMPEMTDDVEGFDPIVNPRDSDQRFFFNSNTIIAMVDSPPAVEELEAVRRVFQPKLALDRQTSRDRRERSKAYGSVDGMIGSQLTDKRLELLQREALLKRLEILAKKGYVSEVQLLQEQATVNSLKQQLLQLDRDRLGNNYTRVDQGQQADQADLSALQSTDQMQNALVNYLAKAFVFSPPGGMYLVAQYRTSGMRVNVGDELFTYSTRPPSLPGRVPVFVDATSVQQITEGMSVLITPKGISRAQYGGITGVVDEVGRLPLTGESLAAVAGSRSLGVAISQALPSPYLVRVRLNIAEPSYCNQLLSRRCYAWSTKRIPPFPVRMGTQADVQITTIYRRPIEFVMPAVRQALGLVVENR